MPKIPTPRLWRRNKVNETDRQGRNAFFYAIQFNHGNAKYFSEIKQILVDKGCDVHAVDNFGNNVLIYEARFGYNTDPDDYKYYDDFSTEEIDLRTIDFGTALNVALTERNYRFAKYLVDHGADTSLIDKKFHDELSVLTGHDVHASIADHPVSQLRLRV